MWTKDEIKDQSGKVFLVTGANTGIGYETALALYEKGAQVVMACRNLGKGEEATARIKANGGHGSLDVMLLDLENLDSVRSFAKAFLEKYTQLDVLINNAGVMMPPASKDANGYELQFGVNYLGHFALTGLLYPLLNETKNSRIVTLSSMAYLRGSIDFDNLKTEKDYEPMREYAQSKLADMFLALELQRRIEEKGDLVISIAAQPGANKTELARHMDQKEYNAAVERIGVMMDPWQGALPSLYAATEAGVKGGDFYGPHDRGYSGYPIKAEIAAHALDEAVSKKLWELGAEVTGVKFP